MRLAKCQRELISESAFFGLFESGPPALMQKHVFAFQLILATEALPS